MSALQVQEGGNHYKLMKVQPVEFIHANNIGYFEGCVIKYVTRWKNKNGIEDLRKAIHFIELLIELEVASSKEGERKEVSLEKAFNLSNLPDSFDVRKM